MIDTYQNALVVQGIRTPKKALAAALDWADTVRPGKRHLVVVKNLSLFKDGDIARAGRNYASTRSDKSGSYGTDGAIISFLAAKPSQFRVGDRNPHCVIPNAPLGQADDGQDYYGMRFGLSDEQWLAWVSAVEPKIIGAGTPRWRSEDFPETFDAAEDLDQLQLVHGEYRGYGGRLHASSAAPARIRAVLKTVSDRRGSAIPWPMLERWAWSQGWSGFAVEELREMTNNKPYIADS